jgi:hypothetical protein
LDQAGWTTVGVNMAESDPEIISVIELFELREDDFLFEMIGKYNPDSLYALPQDSAHLIEAGKKWFSRQSDKIKLYICPKVDKEISKPISEELVTLIFAYLSIEHGKALAAYMTAVVLKKLVQGWCRNEVRDNT